MKTVFIYCLKDPTTGDVRYIGQTNNLKRRLKKHLTVSSKMRSPLGYWLRSLLEPPVLAFLHEVSENESWVEEERRYISCARALGMNLVNATDGGEGTSGPQSPARRAAQSARQKGVPHSPEWRAAQSAAWSLERRAAQSAARMGVPQSPETSAAKSAAMKGKNRGPHSPERRAAQSAARKGVPPSPAQRAANEARRGVPRGPYRKRAK